MSWTPLASYCFFRYDSHIVYRLFLYILLPYCIYYTPQVTETWILFESLCGTCGQFIYLFLLRHVLFAGISPYYCIICVISMCYTCQLYDVCYLYIWYTYVLYFVFHLCYVYCLTKLFMYFMSIHWCTWTWQMIMQELFTDIVIFHHVLTFIWISSFLMRIVLCSIYFYISYTLTLHLSYLWHIYFQQ